MFLHKVSYLQRPLLNSKIYRKNSTVGRPLYSGFRSGSSVDPTPLHRAVIPGSPYTHTLTSDSLLGTSDGWRWTMDVGLSLSSKTSVTRETGIFATGNKKV